MAKPKVSDIVMLQEKMAEIDQFSPLFNDEPDEQLLSSITGDVSEVTIGENVFNSLELKNTGKVARIPIVRGAETKSVFNIGIFVALRDFTSRAGRVYVGGETQRVFAY